MTVKNSAHPSLQGDPKLLQQKEHFTTVSDSVVFLSKQLIKFSV